MAKRCTSRTGHGLHQSGGLLFAKNRTPRSADPAGRCEVSEAVFEGCDG